ncbi:MAG TPA: hypothetical protein VNV39_17175 [Stellaceae bacterium]|jgi:hypothetical protein|nr:hypothetical protein [Stellaceae bacterium]
MSGTGGGSSGANNNGMAMLGKMICDMNPYTEMPKYAMSGALKTGTMDVFLNAPAPGTTAPDISQIQVEEEGHYGAQWDFKGTSYRVNTALQVKYRFPVLGAPPADGGDAPILYWVTESLLIGFVGSNGG